MRPRWTGAGGDRPPGEHGGDGRGPVFVFSPRVYNWQWDAVQRVHQDEPVFREVLLECDREVQRQLGWSLDEFLGREPDTVARTFSGEQYEPILTAVQVAQVELWRRRGVEASAVVGCSGGEFAAAYTAGALSAEEAIRVACAISRMIEEGGAPKGGSIIVQAGLEEVARLRAAMTRPVHILVESAPNSTVFGGDEVTIHEFATLLDRRGIEYRRTPGKSVYHVPLLDSGKAAFLQRLTGLAGRRPAIPVYSAAAGGLLGDARFDAQHWLDLVTRPALVGGVTRGLLRDGYDRFLSISLARGVLFPIRAIASTLGKEVIVSSSLACLAENEAPFLRRHRTPLAMISRAVKRGLRSARRSGC